MKQILVSAFLILLFTNVHAQVKIGGTPVVPVPSAVLELDGGTTRGLLLPRMRKLDIDAIQNPAEGLAIYATDQQAIYLRRSGNWVKMNGVADAFSLPYSGVFSESTEPVLSLTNNINGGIGIYGASGIGAGTGVYGYAFNGNGYGIKGTAIFGRGGYFSSRNSHALITDSGRVGFGTLSPTAFLEVDATKSDASNTIIINDDDDPVIQFRKAGINKSFIKQQGNDLVLRPNDVNNSGKVILQSYNAGGWMFLDAEGNASLGVDPTGFNGTPSNSKMNIRSSAGVNLTLDAPMNGSGGPTLSFVNKVGNITTEYGSIKTNDFGLELNSSSISTYNGTGKWLWRTPGMAYPVNMELRRANNNLGASLLVSNGVSIGTKFTKMGGSPQAALEINMNDPFDEFHNSDIMRLSGEDIIVRMQQYGVDKGFIQLVDDDMKTGTFATNNKGRFIIRTNNADRLWVDSVGYVTIGGKIGPTLNGPYRLAVRGKIAATDFNIVASGSWPDYVFDPSYKLRSLEETEAYINEHKHLPNIPAAAVVDKEGFALGDMQKRMMEKIEELTLYLIDAKKEINILKKQVQVLQPKQ